MKLKLPYGSLTSKKTEGFDDRQNFDYLAKSVADRGVFF